MRTFVCNEIEMCRLQDLEQARPLALSAKTKNSQNGMRNCAQHVCIFAEQVRLKLGKLGAIRLISQCMYLHTSERKVQRNGCRLLVHLANSGTAMCSHRVMTCLVCIDLLSPCLFLSLILSYSRYLSNSLSLPLSLSLSHRFASC